MLDFIRDILASFRQASLERVRSPFLGAFVFSWLGFNWPMLAILFFSKREIEKRLVYIGDNFGIETFIIGPLCTSALIAFLLPQINKLVTKIQDKPNTETIELSLESKIRIAKKQQEIAEIDARKKLAEKKEEKHIEEGIEQIKNEHQVALLDLSEANEQLSAAQRELNKLKGELAKAISQMNVEIESKKTVSKDLEFEKENSKNLSDRVIKLTNDLNNSLSYQEKIKMELEDFKYIAKSLEKEKADTIQHLSRLSDIYNQIFYLHDTQSPKSFRIKNNAKKILANVNNTLLSRSLNSETPSS